MKEFRKLVSKNTKINSPVGLEHADLAKLPHAQLLRVIEKYEQNAQMLNSRMGQKKKTATLASAEVKELKEQIVVLKGTNKLISEELAEKASSNDQLKKLTQTLTLQVLAADELLKEQSKLIEAQKSCFAETALFEEQENIVTQKKGNYFSLTIESSEKENNGHLNMIQEIQGRNKALQGDLAHAKSELSKIVFLKDSMASEVQFLKESLSQRDSTLASKESKLKEKTQAISFLEEEIRSLKHLMDQADKKVKKLLEKNEKLIQDNDTANKLIENANSSKKESEEIFIENFELRSKLQMAWTSNEHLQKEIKLLKEKRACARKEITKLNLKLQKSARSSQSGRKSVTSETSTNSNVDIIVYLKAKLDKAYRGLMGEIERSVEGDCSYYSLNSCYFTRLEKRLNCVLMVLHEQISALEDMPKVGPENSQKKFKCATHR